MIMVIDFAFLAVSVALVRAGGPLCLDCAAVNSPGLCTHVTECQPSEDCFAEHFEYTNGTEVFKYGCLDKQQCPEQLPVKRRRFELSLCEQCCTGNLCNMNKCTNGTAPPSGLPCLTCTNIHAPSECSTISYCGQGEVCFTEKALHNHPGSFNMGCLNRGICTHFGSEIIGKRAIHICHECCETPGCNSYACPGDQTTTEHVTQTTGLTSTLTTSEPAPRDCWDLQTHHGVSTNGVYQILAPSGHYVDVFCDMLTDGGGWTVFQKRYNGAVEFNVSYADYAEGFGNLSSEFWMGNDLLHQLTQRNNQALRIDLCDWGNSTRHAVYNQFLVGPSSDCYRLNLSEHSGTADDALFGNQFISQSQNNMCFSSIDKDQDTYSGSCGQIYHSGWWFSNCFAANLNGVYQEGENIHSPQGLQWYAWLPIYSFRATEMKIRPAFTVVQADRHQDFDCPEH